MTTTYVPENMIEAVRDFHATSGEHRGVKLAAGPLETFKIWALKPGIRAT